MTKPTTLAWMTCALLALHTGAHAQNAGNGPSSGPGPRDDRGNRTDDRASPGLPIEITPYVLMGSPSASGVGAAVRWPVGARLGVELETELKRAEITAVNVALSLVYDLPAIGPVTPYVAAGVGLERFGKAIYRPDGKPLLGSDTGFTVNAGGGIRVPVNDRWGVRSDARWIYGSGRDAPDQWRIYNGATLGVGGKR
jgi:opacity protein-like surface antigen